jgi:hypothetical protein
LLVYWDKPFGQEVVVEEPWAREVNVNGNDVNKTHRIIYRIRGLRSIIKIWRWKGV